MGELRGILWPHTEALNSTSHIRICLVYGFLYNYMHLTEGVSPIIGHLTNYVIS